MATTDCIIHDNLQFTEATIKRAGHKTRQFSNEQPTHKAVDVYHYITTDRDAYLMIKQLNRM